MSSTTNFVSELVRAANEVEKLSISEIRLLINRAIVAIRDLCELAGLPGGGTATDAIIGLRSVASSAGPRSGPELAAALLQAAEMIRTLWIVVDRGVETGIKMREIDV